MRHTLQNLKPQIKRLAYLKTGNRIRTAIINEMGHCGISEDVIQDYMDQRAALEQVPGENIGQFSIDDWIDYSPCDGQLDNSCLIPAKWRAMDRKEVTAPKIEGLNYFPEDDALIEKAQMAHQLRLEEAADARRMEVEPILPKPEPMPEPDPATKLVYTTPSNAMKVMQDVARHFGITVEGLQSPSRREVFVNARGAAIRLLRERSAVTYSYPRLAQIFGGRDHSTILHAWRSFDVYAKRDPRVFEIYEKLGGKMTKEEALNAPA